MRGQSVPGAGVTLGCGVGFGWVTTGLGLGAGATAVRKFIHQISWLNAHNKAMWESEF